MKLRHTCKDNYALLGSVKPFLARGDNPIYSLVIRLALRYETVDICAKWRNLYGIIKFTHIMPTTPKPNGKSYRPPAPLIPVPLWCATPCLSSPPFSILRICSSSNTKPCGRWKPRTARLPKPPGSSGCPAPRFTRLKRSSSSRGCKGFCPASAAPKRLINLPMRYFSTSKSKPQPNPRLKPRNWPGEHSSDTRSNCIHARFRKP